MDAVILERAAGALRLVLDRTRGPAPVSPTDDPALVETVLDPTASEQARLHAARRLGLDPDDPTTRTRALAPLGDSPRILRVRREAGPADGARQGLWTGRVGQDASRDRAGEGEPGSRNDGRAGIGEPGGQHGQRPGTGEPGGRRGQRPGVTELGDRRGGRPEVGGSGDRGDGRADDAEPSGGRIGIGPAVPVLGLPGSWEGARTALRFTAEGTARDPGERVVYADDLGGIALLAELISPGAEPPPDVRDLERAAADSPWMLTTLHAVASTASLRAAATAINVHHSTLQDRLTHAEALLGWPVRTPQGRLRLHLALTMRHLAHE